MARKPDRSSDADRTPETDPTPGPGLSILVVRSGGIAGLRRQWQVEPDDDADEWVALVEACPWDRVGTDPASADRFVWRIEATVPPTVHTASVPDAQLIGPWRVLVDRVQEVGSDG